MGIRNLKKKNNLKIAVQFFLDVSIAEMRPRLHL